MFLDGSGEVAQGLGPHGLQHGPKRSKRFLVGPVEPAVAVGAHVDEAGTAQDGEVLGHRTECDLESLGDFARCQFLVPDQAKDLTSVWLGYDLEGVHS